jgi:hypothetical protein
MEPILEAKLQNGRVQFKYDKKNVRAIIETLRQIEKNISLDLDEKELEKANYAYINLTPINSQELAIEINGDSKGDLYNLIAHIIMNLNKSLTKDNLLDQVTISSDVLLKYDKWLHELSKKFKNEKIEKIEDETAYIDEDQNLIIKVGVNNETFEFKIPKDKWSF